jgi:tripartite-type tricarboxylate transporter receptor subunit TctC
VTCACVAAYTSALAQQYPNRPIKFIVPYAPGGGSDATSRIIAKPLAEMLGQQIVIDNRPGAGTIIGAELAAKSLPADCEVGEGNQGRGNQGRVTVSSFFRGGGSVKRPCFSS